MFLTERGKPDAVRRCQNALRKHGGHRARAAAELSISKRSLQRYLAEYPEILSGVDGMSFLGGKVAERSKKRASRKARLNGAKR